jgi:hypothetical protein
MPEAPFRPPEDDRSYHTYETHRIPWLIRLLWVGFWVGAVWYVLRYAIPMARNYF